MRRLLNLTMLALTVPLLIACETSNQSYSQNSRVVDLTQRQDSSANAQYTPRPVPPAKQNNQQYANSAGVAGAGLANTNNSYQQRPNSSIQDEAVYETPASGAINASGPSANNAASTSEVIDYSYSNNTYNQSQPTYSQTQPSYNQPNYNQSQPSYNQPTYNQTQPSYNQPTYSQNQPTYNQSQPSYNQPTYNQNQPSYNTGYANNNSGYNQSYQNDSTLSQNQSNGPSTSSGNWLVLDSAAAEQDITNTKAELDALKAKQKSDSSSKTIYQNSIATNAGPDHYRVVQGDTLYSIAFRYGLDYHALADINKISPPYNLAVGQVLTLNLKASQAPVYVVKSGDTLYSIANKYGQSVSFLAGVNNLEPPYNLVKGQKLKLSRDGTVAATKPEKDNMEVPVAGKEQVIASNNNNTNTKPNKDQAQKPATVPPVAQTPIINSKTRSVAGVTWSWPTAGKVIEQFSTAEQGNKGIDIAGNRGQAVLSAADGQVVYSGSALRGFGNLIIINHSNEYLSAYAHNEALLVKEGQKVKRGQQIAKMGNTDASSVRLHFEIRYRGQSVNPISYLPK